jgi:hypothetical protein
MNRNNQPQTRPVAVEVAVNQPNTRQQPMNKESIIEWLGQQLKDERAKNVEQAARIEALEEIVKASQEELGMFVEENAALNERIKELETPAITQSEAALLSSLGCPGFGEVS